MKIELYKALFSFNSDNHLSYTAVRKTNYKLWLDAYSMATCIIADSKQETTRVAGIKVDICFDSVEVKQAFVNVINSKRRGRLEIIKVNSDGYFEGQIKW